MWPADTGLHARGTHRTWPDAHLDDVRPGVGEVTHPVGGHDVSRYDRHPPPGVFGKPVTFPARHAQCGDHLLLVAVGGIDHQHIGLHLQHRPHLGDHVSVDSDRDSRAQSTLLVECGGVES